MNKLLINNSIPLSEFDECYDFYVCTDYNGYSDACTVIKPGDICYINIGDVGEDSPHLSYIPEKHKKMILINLRTKSCWLDEHPRDWDNYLFFKLPVKITDFIDLDNNV